MQPLELKKSEDVVSKYKRRLENIFAPEAYELLYSVMIDETQPMQLRVDIAKTLVTEATVPEEE